MAKPATPLRRIPDVIEQLSNDRARLVEALRKVGTPARLTTEQRRALLRSLGEE